MSLCKCSGTTGLVHISCLKHWLNAQNVDHCDRCHHRFPTVAQATCIRQFFHWSLPTDSPRDVQGDRFCFALMTPVAALGGFFCALDAFEQVLKGQIMRVISMVTLAGLLITAYLCWCVFMVHFDYRAFALCQSRNPMRKCLVQRTAVPEFVQARSAGGQQESSGEKEDISATSVTETERTMQLDEQVGSRLPSDRPPNFFSENPPSAHQQFIFAGFS
ncbi:hypothetical protein MRX96_056824 [Rhipicephalus microplus]|uniref:RING-CH-type domain-containing protein n=1 Tax=Rhipicephalus microplus TaxID=6941 RepID=A0A9J6EHT6_RHIMP|nr:hypothetical protein HPB51_016534 [Rhipicephalus microplus]